MVEVSRSSVLGVLIFNFELKVFEFSVWDFMVLVFYSDWRLGVVMA